MSKELKPCPLCGGEVTAIETHPGYGELYCGRCDLVLAGNEAKTPDELTATWNMRSDDALAGGLRSDMRDLRQALADASRSDAARGHELESLVRSMFVTWRKFHGYHGRDVQSVPEQAFIEAFERDMAELGIEVVE